VPPPSPPAGPHTGPLRAVPLGQPGPNAAAGQGSAAVPPPSPPPPLRPGPPTGPLHAVPLGQPGPSAAAGQGSAAVPLPPPPLRPGPHTGPLRRPPWPARPQCCCWPGLRSGAATVAAATAIWTAVWPAARRLPWPARPESCCWPGIRSGAVAATAATAAAWPVVRRWSPPAGPRCRLLWGPPQRGLHRLQLPTASHAARRGLAAAAVRHGATSRPQVGHKSAASATPAAALPPPPTSAALPGMPPSPGLLSRAAAAVTGLFGRQEAMTPPRHRADSAHAHQAVDGPLREVHRTRSPALRTGDDHSGPPSRDLSPVRRSLRFQGAFGGSPSRTGARFTAAGAHARCCRCRLSPVAGIPQPQRAVRRQHDGRRRPRRRRRRRRQRRWPPVGLIRRHCRDSSCSSSGAVLGGCQLRGA